MTGLWGWLMDVSACPWGLLGGQPGAWYSCLCLVLGTPACSDLAPAPGRGAQRSLSAARPLPGPRCVCPSAPPWEKGKFTSKPTNQAL